jgi:transposase
VEITGNTRLLYEALTPHVARVLVVDSNQFRVISRSVKKTDSNDARLLALYLSKGLLLEVRMKSKQHAHLASLTQTRDTLVKQRSALKNKINNILSARGLNLPKEALSSEKRLTEILSLPFDAMVLLELRVIAEASSKIEGHSSLISIKGIGATTSAILLKRDWRGEGFSRREAAGLLLRHRAARSELESNRTFWAHP